MVRKKNVEEVSGSFVWVEALNSQAAKFGKSYKARLVVALSLAERGSATIALPPQVHSAVFVGSDSQPVFAAIGAKVGSQVSNDGTSYDKADNQRLGRYCR
ncbi:hypothetical protein [Leisingera sp. ANG59]|uniref:hypothetical protein n=1 Tax=Leisingera sp. ANG59 TaxID=2675221 RepID=UPI001574A809|nr:hypothetical protein [Leisingera sp. ANG59]NSY41457.1 hypothetical protein [Leisingera sp. ANG59]